MRDLPKRVHPGVRAPGPAHASLAAEARNRLLQRPLHGRACD